MKKLLLSGLFLVLCCACVADFSYELSIGKHNFSMVATPTRFVVKADGVTKEVKSDGRIDFTLGHMHVWGMGEGREFEVWIGDEDVRVTVAPPEPARKRASGEIVKTIGGRKVYILPYQIEESSPLMDDLICNVKTRYHRFEIQTQRQKPEVPGWYADAVRSLKVLQP